ncbi:Major vault protein, partial [Clonorchis sinensis]
MPPEGSTRAGILPGCPSLDRGIREAEVGFEPRNFRSMPPLETSSNITSVPPYHYVHVLDLNTNISTLVMGPKTYVCKENERFECAVSRMVSISPMEYCVVENPVVKENGHAIFESNGQVRLQMGAKEYRYHQDPFPLYPGETICGTIQALPVVLANRALRLKAICDHEDSEGRQRSAGDEWLFEGPGVYYPCIQVEVLGEVTAKAIKLNEALRFRATCDCVDRHGTRRFSGEEWLVRTTGVYLPTVYEEYVDTVIAEKLNEKRAVSVRAIQPHRDQFGRQRNCGDEWLVTYRDADSYICDVTQELVRVTEAITLSSKEYCIIVNPVDLDGHPQWGKKRLVRGESSFFLMPGEELETGIEQAFTLGENDGLVLVATEDVEQVDSLEDGNFQRIKHQPGDRWLIRGPCEYIPPIGVDVVEKRTAVPLGESEGIYVRNTQTGEVRAVVGTTYMLTEYEEHWEKQIPPKVKELLDSDKVPTLNWSRFQELRDTRAPLAAYYQTEASGRVMLGSLCGDTYSLAHDQPPAPRFFIPDEPKPFPVISLQVPHNAGVQINDYKSNISRVEFGPTLVILGPHEQFTLLSLSAGKPKRPHAIKSLYLLLGPDFFTDSVVVETADHARLSLQLSYNWSFDTSDALTDPGEADKLFSVSDFVGDSCKAMASRIRGAVATVCFDTFHKNSARIIRAACLGLTKEGKVRDSYVFPENRLVITGVDIQSVAPTDERTRDLLWKSVQMAIEITTESQEAAARQAAKLEQEARGRLDRQKILDETEVAKSKSKLLEIQLASAGLENTGEARAAALGQAEALRIENMIAVEESKAAVEEKRIEL